ncbi:MAG: UDP-N-acetylmuramate dehydrogenase [Candidatus Paceibacterota bacterium]|jgi:UDP-N-acetylmuramate dehydrogenase
MKHSSPSWIKKNVSLENYNTFRINTKAKYFTIVSGKEQLIKTLKWAKANSLPFFILGNGSNILFAEKRYPGLVIKIRNNRIRKIYPKAIVVGAGMMLEELLKKFIDLEFSGLEWVAGIPGTVGGAIFGNAGSFGNEMADCLKKVKTINPETYQEKIYSFKDCKFKYRESVFKQNKEIIWEAEVLTKKGKRKEIIKKANENRRYKINRGLLKYPSAGSVFKNIFAKEAPVKYRKEAVIKGGKISAGWFIEQCGLKGKKCGGAMISSSHANIIINVNKATPENILDLINLCKEKVYKKFKIKLEEEIIVIHY